MFKIPVGCDFLRWGDMRDNMNYTSPSIEYCTAISDARASKTQKCKDLPILSKLVDSSCRNLCVVRLVGEFFPNMQKKKKKKKKLWRKVDSRSEDL